MENGMQVFANEARVNVTWGGQNGDLTAPVPYDAPEGDIKQWVAEAIRSGNVPGIRADAQVDLADFVIDRHPAHEGRPHNLIGLRPKTPFGV